MLAAALGRHVRHGALEDLEQGLLHALARDVAGDRRIAALAGDLVDLVDVDDALLGRGHVVVRRLEQAHQDVLDVLAHVAGLGQGRGVGDGEGHVQETGQGLGQQRLAGAGGADEHDVALVDLHLVAGARLVDALVVVVDGHGQADLGLVLLDDVVVEVAADLLGLGELRRGLRGLVHHLALEDVVAELDALAADVDRRRPGDELGHLVLSAAAEGALDHLRSSGLPAFHRIPPGSSRTYFFFVSPSISERFSITLSTRP